MNYLTCPAWRTSSPSNLERPWEPEIHGGRQSPACLARDGHSPWPSLPSSVSRLGQFTFTVMAADVVTLPAASYAFAVSVWLPFAADSRFQLTLYGDVVSVPSTVAPS